ncbi:uncharacterized protein DS421_19g649660 [Arachis hypogaea]|uniref:Aminotransferase-like plant mobile domain-containing protein n=1 Tax=Arachis hypogaea TaxID=3818 RepID=A0A6B9V6Y2_ARAHY|nr:uncharacterized protein DS421_19g649660 [Arachis hypogaea]
MEDERWLYRLNGIAHIAETINEEDVAYQLGLPVDAQPVSGCMTDFHLHIEGARPAVLPADASKETVRIYARASIMMLLSTQLFMNKSGNRVHLHWFPFVARPNNIGSYSWGTAALAWLYRCRCPYNADWSPHYQIVWEPYGSLDVLAIIHPEILTEEHNRLWQAVTSLIYFAVIDWHQVDRVFPQLGGVQHLPEPALNIEYLHSKDGRGGDRWFPTYYRTWHEHWDEQVCSVLSIQRVADPSPSAEFLDWWYRVVHRTLSPGIAFADPKPVEVPDYAILRGSSQAPVRVPASDMSNNRRVEQRRRIGTRANDREWRWLNDMMQEEQLGGGDDEGQADHRLRRSSARRRAARARRRAARARRRAARARRAPSVHHDDEAGSSRGHPTDTQAGGTAEASMLAGPQFYADFAEIIRSDDVQQYQSPIPEGPSERSEYRPQPADVPSQVPESQLLVDLNELAGSPYDT